MIRKNYDFRNLQNIESYIPHKAKDAANCYNSEEFVFQVKENYLFLVSLFNFR